MPTTAHTIPCSIGLRNQTVCCLIVLSSEDGLVTCTSPIPDRSLAQPAAQMLSLPRSTFSLGASPLQHLIPLVLGGVLAAPIGGWAVKHVSARALMIAVGVLIVTLSVFQLLRAFRLI